MSAFGSAAKLAAVFGVAVATATFFLYGQIERPPPSPPASVESPKAASSPTTQPAATSSTSQPVQDPLPKHPVRTIPIPRPTDDRQSGVGAETTGSSKQESTAKPRS